MARRAGDIHILIQIGEAIRKRREELGMSQSELGAAAELHRTYVSDVERGRRNLSVLSLDKLAQALDVPIATLFILHK